ncbi:MoaD/ThiS family protein [Gordonia asplenii]|uniref:MoaD/ThiS family protein n=1 Tax=Gordonia asplenii TaxID=2725283 RepID=UPI0028A96F3E|nr:MoaD/ThiS family protein [Gordonia asplenii]
MADPTGTHVTVSYFAAIADAVGCRTESFDLADATVAALRTAIEQRHGARAGALAQLCTVLSGDDMLRESHARIGATVDLLPPFAGG